jgi:hypothetical protein
MKTREEMILESKMERNSKQREALQKVLRFIDDLKQEEMGYTQTPEMRAYMAAYDSVNALYEELVECENGEYTRTI